MIRRQLRSLLLLILAAGVILAFIFLPQISSRWQRKAGSAAVHVTTDTNRFPMTVVDVCQREITIKQKPLRIISLAPGITETLFVLGAGDRLIAVTNYCDYPPETAKLPKIGGYLDPNVEKITSLAPDLIVGARGNRREILDHLYQLGLPIVVVDPTSLGEVAESIKLIGKVTGTAKKATEVVRQFQARERLVREKLAQVPEKKRPKTLFLYALDGGIFTVGPGSHIDELITLAGGENIAKFTGKAWPQLSMEAVVAANPDIILVLAGQMGNLPPLTREKALAQLRADTHWRDIAAVKTGRVAILDDDLITVPGPRLVDGLEAMAVALHPELFAAKVDGER